MTENKQLKQLRKTIENELEHLKKLREVSATMEAEIPVQANRVATAEQALATGELDATLRGETIANNATRQKYLDAVHLLQVLQARFEGLKKRESEIKPVLRNLLSQLQEARRFWEKEAVAEYLKKVLPTYEAFAEVAIETLGLLATFQPQEPNSTFSGLLSVVDGLRQLCNHAGITLPESLARIPENVDQIPEVAAIRRSLAGPSDLENVLVLAIDEIERRPLAAKMTVAA